MKKLLVIGAGFLQSFVIKKAHEMGIYTLALDADEKAVGFEYADEYGVVDIVDEEACLDYARRHEIDGVLTAATDYGVLSTAYIAEKIGLVGLKYSVAKTVKNKFLTRKILFDAAVDDTAPLFEVADEGTIEKIKSQIEYPVMVKPCDGSGSRGVAMVENEEKFAAACRDAMRWSRSGRAMLETFFEGREYGAEAFVHEGKVHVLGVMLKRMTSPPYYAELGHIMPCGLSVETENKVRGCVEKAIKALGINFGSVNTDILITPKGEVHIVDVGARMGGNLIGTHVIHFGAGIDYVENMIRAALGEKVDFTPKRKPCCIATRILALSAGEIKRLPEFSKVITENVTLEHHLHVGDEICEYHTNLDGCGYTVATGANAVEAETKAEAARRQIDESIIRY